MSQFLIIDGYNVISKIKEFDVKKDISLETARHSFIKRLVYSRKIKNLFDSVIIVFDGRAEATHVDTIHGFIKIIFTSKDIDADHTIVNLLKNSGPCNRITVVSDDNFVKNHAKAFSADIISPSTLGKIIGLKRQNCSSKILKKDLRSEESYRITEELKKYWGIDYGKKWT